ncbi:MAG: type II toxin-antitoxin system VapC family toxin [Candidatus Riflebacteria bacterium]|nr:type II toxin-antitoxin system VapC family toxin [Candidatus Riflebacteria bacterium]
MKLVLDTSIYIGFAAAEPEVVEFLATRGEQLFLPSIVLGELHFGFLKGRRQEFNQKKLGQFIACLDVKIVRVDEDVARKYGLIYLSLQKKGTPLPIDDVWIGACCMATGGTLLTKDRHFEEIEQIDTVVLEQPVPPPGRRR